MTKIFNQPWKMVKSVCPECGKSHSFKIEAWEWEGDYRGRYCDKCLDIELHGDNWDAEKG